MAQVIYKSLLTAHKTFAIKGQLQKTDTWSQRNKRIEYYDESRKYIMAALEFEPDNEYLLQQLGCELRHLGRFDEAERVLLKNKDDRFSLANLGYAYNETVASLINEKEKAKKEGLAEDEETVIPIMQEVKTILDQAKKCFNWIMQDFRRNGGRSRISFTLTGFARGKICEANELVWASSREDCKELTYAIRGVRDYRLMKAFECSLAAVDFSTQALGANPKNDHNVGVFQSIITRVQEISHYVAARPYLPEGFRREHIKGLDRLIGEILNVENIKRHRTTFLNNVNEQVFINLINSAQEAIDKHRAAAVGLLDQVCSAEKGVVHAVKYLARGDYFLELSEFNTALRSYVESDDIGAYIIGLNIDLFDLALCFVFPVGLVKPHLRFPVALAKRIIAEYGEVFTSEITGVENTTSLEENVAREIRRRFRRGRYDIFDFVYARSHRTSELKGKIKKSYDTSGYSKDDILKFLREDPLELEAIRGLLDSVRGWDEEQEEIFEDRIDEIQTDMNSFVVKVEGLKEGKLGGDAVRDILRSARDKREGLDRKSGYSKDMKDVKAEVEKMIDRGKALISEKARKINKLAKEALDIADQSFVQSIRNVGEALMEISRGLESLCESKQGDQPNQEYLSKDRFKALSDEAASLNGRIKTIKKCLENIRSARKTFMKAKTFVDEMSLSGREDNFCTSVATEVRNLESGLRTISLGLSVEAIKSDLKTMQGYFERIVAFLENERSLGDNYERVKDILDENTGIYLEPSEAYQDKVKQAQEALDNVLRVINVFRARVFSVDSIGEAEKRLEQTKNRILKRLPKAQIVVCGIIQEKRSLILREVQPLENVIEQVFGFIEQNILSDYDDKAPYVAEFKQGLNNVRSVMNQLKGYLGKEVTVLKKSDSAVNAMKIVVKDGCSFSASDLPHG